MVQGISRLGGVKQRYKEAGHVSEIQVWLVNLPKAGKTTLLMAEPPWEEFAKTAGRQLSCAICGGQRFY